MSDRLESEVTIAHTSRFEVKLKFLKGVLKAEKIATPPPLLLLLCLYAARLNPLSLMKLLFVNQVS